MPTPKPNPTKKAQPPASRSAPRPARSGRTETTSAPAPPTSWPGAAIAIVTRLDRYIGPSLFALVVALAVALALITMRAECLDVGPLRARTSKCREGTRNR